MEERNGFTLAEVLITIAIIGVVAAITLPILINNYQKEQTVNQLKKEYTSLAQAVKTSEIDNGNNAGWDWGTSGDAASIKQSFNTYWAPYLNIIKDCSSSYVDCGYNSLTPWKYSDSSTSASASVVDSATRTTIILADGSLLVIGYLGGTKNIFLDLNAGKGPNVYGKDVFLFVLDEYKGLVPYEYNQTESTINTRCGTASWSGSGCSAKIIQDSWRIASDYPWK